jgi:hypothetical protein
MGTKPWDREVIAECALWDWRRYAWDARLGWSEVLPYRGFSIFQKTGNFVAISARWVEPGCWYIPVDERRHYLSIHPNVMTSKNRLETIDRIDLMFRFGFKHPRGTPPQQTAMHISEDFLGWLVSGCVAGESTAQILRPDGMVLEGPPRGGDWYFGSREAAAEAMFNFYMREVV